jgi:hypothetical protein
MKDRGVDIMFWCFWTATIIIMAIFLWAMVASGGDILVTDEQGNIEYIIDPILPDEAVLYDPYNGETVGAMILEGRGFYDKEEDTFADPGLSAMPEMRDLWEDED